jgi:hypothetical protein
MMSTSPAFGLDNSARGFAKQLYEAAAVERARVASTRAAALIPPPKLTGGLGDSHKKRMYKLEQKKAADSAASKVL